MIYQQLRRYQRLDRDIEALTYVVVGLLFILTVRAVLIMYECQYSQLWALLAPTTTLIAALVVARVANRLIVNGNIIREDDRRQEIVRMTHHLIAITKDLHSRVAYLREIFGEGNRPAIALSQIATTIENRYETLLDRDSYKYLPGNCIDIITRMSGSVFGIGLIAEWVQNVTASNPVSALEEIPQGDIQVQVSTLDKLLLDLQELIDELFKLRVSIEGESQSAVP